MILAIGRRRLEPKGWDDLRLVCSAWWSGWTSATIARVGFPAPKPLSPQADERLEKVSVVLVALGMISVARVLITGRLRPSVTGR